MIKDFLIINCIGKNDKIALKFNNEFYIHDFDKKVNRTKERPIASKKISIKQLI